jgi:hypothetical protein
MVEGKMVQESQVEEGKWNGVKDEVVEAEK